MTSELSITSKERASEAIVSAAARYFDERHRDRLSALILTGSLARDEGSIVEDAGLWRVMGDAEFLLIFRERAHALPDGAALRSDCSRIEAELLEQGVVCAIGADRAYPSYLRRMRPHIYGYELRRCGRVLVGDDAILTAIPRFSAADIPLEDGWQLLMNRLIELLQSACEEPSAIDYRLAKLSLDMASSLLLFAGAFVAGYGARTRRLKELAAGIDGPPFPMREFAELVESATEYKLGGSAAPCDAAWNSLERTIGYAHRLWRWELARLTGLSADSGDNVLMDRLSSMQPVSTRLRGWASTLRCPSLRREWRVAPRRAAASWSRSPRHSVYAAAAKLVFQLPELLGSGVPRDAASLSKARRELPLRSTRTGECADWRGLARDIVHNYQTLLIGTRA